MNRLTIVKIGGPVIENTKLLKECLSGFKQISGNKIMVHGGGNAATALASRLGIEAQMINGRRKTDANMLEVVIMVYGGLINKKIVAELQAIGCNSAGFTGADFDLIRARKRNHPEIDFGFVGDIEDIHTSELRILLEEGVIPVIAPLTHDGKSQLLNINADTVASEMAKELSNYYNTYLVYCSDKEGVLADPEKEESVISHLQEKEFAELIENNSISAGMIPKLENGFNAKKNGVTEVIITNVQNLSTGKGTRLSIDTP
jgi:acetylglutamate kinase